MEDRKREEVEDVLSEEILADARRKGERTVKRAEREGEKAVARAVKKAERVRRHVLQGAQKRIERERHVSESALRLEERMSRLKAEGALLDEAFNDALTRLHARDGFDYKRIVTELAVEAVLAMTGDDFVLRLAEAEPESIKRSLPREVARAVREKAGRAVKITVAGEAAPIETGVVVESTDGVQHFDNSFAGRLERMKGDLRTDIARVLFGETGEPATSGKEPSE